MGFKKIQVFVHGGVVSVLIWKGNRSKWKNEGGGGLVNGFG